MSNSVCIATVTYGNREQLLTQVIQAGMGEGVKDYVIVDNASLWNVKNIENQFPQAKFHIIHLSQNTGSAYAYQRAIKEAYSTGAEFIWLLDDDNKPEKKSLKNLINIYEIEESNNQNIPLAVVAFRPKNQTDIAMGIPERFLFYNSRIDNFCGFHIFDIPYKLWKRTPLFKSTSLLKEKYYLKTSPYGGLLFRRDLVDLIDLPNPEFVVYSDDLEFTYRITKNNGKIILVTSAMVHDLETSWDNNKKYSNSLEKWVLADDDFRAYYAMRNLTYFCRYCYTKNYLVFWVNMLLYMVVLQLLALRYSKLRRFSLLKQAITDGISKTLGFHSEYQL